MKPGGRKRQTISQSPVRQPFSNAGIESQSRIIVLVRTHFVSQKLLDLIRMLKEGVGYDLLICADETKGRLDLPRDLVVEHNTAMCSDLGLVGSIPYDTLLWYFGDYPFYCAYHSVPGYDYYIMIEWDVEFVRGNVYALESLLSRLSRPGDAPYDLVATHYGRRGMDWGWTETCVGRFKEFYGLFFPPVILSRRALECLFDWRKWEAVNPPESGRHVFCEAFVPTALMAARGYRCADIGSVLPGCWEPSTFRIGRPMLLDGLPALNRKIEVIHPVYSEREYLESELYEASEANEIAAFVARLNDPGLSISAELRSAYLNKCAAANGSVLSSRGRKRKGAGVTVERPQWRS